MTYKTYGEKLKDPRWQKVRLEVYQRDNFTCCYCQDTTTTLHVHHLEYAGDPWDVPMDKLITLCEHCHTLIELDKTIPGEIVTILKVFKPDGGVLISVIVEVDGERSAFFYGFRDGLYTVLFQLTRPGCDKIWNLLNPTNRTEKQ